MMRANLDSNMQHDKHPNDINAGGRELKVFVVAHACLLGSWLVCVGNRWIGQCTATTAQPTAQSPSHHCLSVRFLAVSLEQLHLARKLEEEYGKERYGLCMN